MNNKDRTDFKKKKKNMTGVKHPEDHNNNKKFYHPYHSSSGRKGERGKA